MLVFLQFLMTTRAEAFLRMCKLDKALQDVNKVLQSNSNHSHALAVRGDAMFQVRGRSQIMLCNFHYFLTTHLLTYCYIFSIILLNVYNGYIFLTNHPPQWHNVICERPLIYITIYVTISIITSIFGYLCT